MIRFPPHRRPRRRAHVVVSALTSAALAAVAIGCGGAPPPAASSSSSSSTANVDAGGVVTDASPASGEGVAPAADTGAARAVAAPLPDPTADPKGLVERMRGGLAGCYENGKKAAPEMADGRVVLNIAVSAAGKATCVVPSDATGLTREVTECMAARAERESYPTGAALAVALPIAVTSGEVSLLPDAKGPVLEKIESEGVQGAGVTIQKMLPELRACLHDGLAQSPAPTMKGVVYATAKLGKKGEIVCAVATRGDVPTEVRACVVGRLSKAKFAAPKWGSAVVSIPLKVVPSLK